MLRKTLSLLLAVSVLSCSTRLTTAQTSSTPNPPATGPGANAKPAQHADKTKAQIAKLGVGPGARIELVLRDKTRVKGYVSHTDENYFVVSDGQTGITTRLAYAEVKGIKNEKIDTATKIAIGVALGLMLLAGASCFNCGP
jgi:hypothetical protein